ncbi:MAG: hypothetical protein WCG93_02725 [Paludibacter sp.]
MRKNVFLFELNGIKSLIIVFVKTMILKMIFEKDYEMEELKLIIVSGVVLKSRNNTLLVTMFNYNV